MLDEIDRAYRPKRAAEHSKRAPEAQQNGHAIAARQRFAADCQASAAEILRREVARQLG